MIGLKKIPTFKDTQKYIDKITFDKKLSVDELVLCAEWSRIDPRLGEVLIEYLSKNWQSYNPLEINNKLNLSPWPQCMGVIVDHIKLTFKKSQNKQLFNTWSACVLAGVTPTSYQAYFIGLYKFAGPLQVKQSINPLKVYSCWGFYSSHLMFNKNPNVKKTTLSKKNRLQLLKQFVKQNKKITVNSYIEFLNFAITRRQAQRDLSEYKKLTPKGHTRNKTYSYNRNSSL